MNRSLGLVVGFSQLTWASNQRKVLLLSNDWVVHTHVLRRIKVDVVWTLKMCKTKIKFENYGFIKT